TLNQLMLFDYTLPETQQLRGTIQLPLYSELVEIGEASGGFTLACVASKGNPAGDVIAIYDITNPAAWVHRSTITGFRTHLMSVSSSRMYIFTTASEFKIIELAFPTTPGMRSTTLYGGSYTNYTALASWSNNAAALGTATTGLWLINTTNATAPLVSGIWNPVTGYSVHALAKGPGVLYVSATAATPTTPPAPPATHNRFESLLVTNLAAPAQRFLHSPTSGAGSQGYLDSLTYLSTPAGNFVVATRPGLDNYPYTFPAQNNTATLYALGSFFATENITAPVATVTLEQAHGNVAPGGASAPGGGSGSARFIAAADAAGLYQVAMPAQWAPAYAAVPVNTTVCHGADTFFNSLVSANPSSVTFQWYRNGTALT
ncbi:MAG: hypothetical protein Q8L55_00300, partial [Phycisphaerales bacterium]|nr:hypothetical protein [Phycisphaerales bacterium]